MKTKREQFVNHDLYWKVNTPALIEEIIINTTEGHALKQPLLIFRAILVELTERASQINDPKLNALMCRLALYGEADPRDKENYNHVLAHKTIEEGMKSKN